ncbi:restriction endonuclease subunit S [Amycolatopsis sp. La24]|uniref:restriction endonuclease subunit S n=1 Tax=Amycolatopsis sp. La24 TaxID=3028304 RepID=UPI0023B1CF36|nr:restriction endonuclease subunit S [Amycolatopsis sp. La24]
MSKKAPVIPTVVDWPSRTVGDLTTLLRRGTAPVYVDESDVMAIGQRCVTDADFDGSRSRPHSAKPMSNVVIPQTGDVLINSTGAGTIGRSVVFQEDGARYIVDGHVTVARPREKDLVGRWLNDILRSPQGQRYLEARCYAGSTNQIELSSSAFAAMPVAVPSVDEQRRVAEVLDALDAQIRLTSRVIAKLEKAGHGLMNDLLSRGVDQNGHTRPTGSFEMRTSNAGSFPANWTVVRLDQIAEVERGKFGHRPRNDPMYLGGPFPFIQTGDIAAAAGGEIVDASQSLSHLGAAVSRSFPAGTIAVTIAANIADTAMLGQPMYFPDSVVGVAVRPPNRAEYVQFVLRAAKPRLEARAPQSAQRNINLQDLRPLEVPLPDPAEQARICAVMKAHSDVVLAERKSLAKTKAQKAAILADLLTGRARVPAEAAS